MSVAEHTVAMIGYGAIGRAVFARIQAQIGVRTVRISHVVVSTARIAQVQSELGNHALAVDAVPEHCTLLLECAGHRALAEHIEPALRRGVECAILSIGALCTQGMAERLAQAAQVGGTQLHLLSGAIGGIDALAAARFAGLTEVTYTGRKPALAWKDTPADGAFDLAALTQDTEILNASAREAARLYPKNANVAATIALAGLGLDATRVRLIADPKGQENVHELRAVGAFGEMVLRLQGKPLADNPKTSALTVYSAVRFLINRSAPICI
jgi:aspartate dehydrogenase